MRMLQAASFGVLALLGDWDCRAAEAVLVPAVGLRYTAVAATRVTQPGASNLNLQIVTTEARVERSDGTQALVRRVYKDLPAGSPLVNSDNNYSIYRYFTVEEISLEIRQSGTDATVHQVTRNDCDPAALASFFPLGHVERVTVGCTQTVSRNGAVQTPGAYTMTISYEGESPVSGAFGKAMAHRIRMAWAVGGWATDGVIAFDDTRGLILDADFTVSRGELKSSTHSTLTSISP